MRNKPVYTKAIHAHRLKLMLKRKDLRHSCPAARKFSGHSSPFEIWAGIVSPCTVCLSFLALKRKFTLYCPCHQLNCEKARKQSYKALKDFYEAKK